MTTATKPKKEVPFWATRERREQVGPILEIAADLKLKQIRAREWDPDDGAFYSLARGYGLVIMPATLPVPKEVWFWSHEIGHHINRDSLIRGEALWFLEWQADSWAVGVTSHLYQAEHVDYPERVDALRTALAEYRARWEKREPPEKKECSYWTLAEELGRQVNRWTADRGEPDWLTSWNADLWAVGFLVRYYGAADVVWPERVRGILDAFNQYDLVLQARERGELRQAAGTAP